MFSYEIPLIITVLPVVMIVGSLTPDAIVAAPKWLLVRHGAALVCHDTWVRSWIHFVFYIRSVESNRTPFDVPEGESEIVAGHMTEYSDSSTPRFMAEYIGMFAISGLAYAVPRRLASAAPCA